MSSASVEAYRIPRDQSSSAGESSALTDEAPNKNAYFVVASDKPHEETQEFNAFVPAPPPPAAPERRAVERAQTMMRMFPERQQSFNPRPPPMGGGGMDVPGWLHELVTFRRPTPTAPIEAIGERIKMQPDVKQAQDDLAYTLLRAIQAIQNNGEINAKLLLSRQSPPNELSDLVGNATVLAHEAFGALPPYLACLSVDDLTDRETTDDSMYDSPPGPKTHSLPHSVVPLSVPLGYQSLGMSAPPGDMDCSVAQETQNFDTHAPTAPPHAVIQQDLSNGGYFAPPPPSASIPSNNYPPAPSGVFCPPMGSTPYGLPGFGRVRGKTGFEGVLDLYAAGGMKKLPSVGDRPLTPPAQGWYAKYSSGVTGVVWDRVHQAWVVSWTLAGKRTFRHFTCKSFGGFDKAREAAIEFRLARNRDIAAYNKRYKDRR